jgi:hypothetical protein
MLLIYVVLDQYSIKSSIIMIVYNTEYLSTSYAMLHNNVNVTEAAS